MEVIGFRLMIDHTSTFLGDLVVMNLTSIHSHYVISFWHPECGG